MKRGSIRGNRLGRTSKRRENGPGGSLQFQGNQEKRTAETAEKGLVERRKGKQRREKVLFRKRRQEKDLNQEKRKLSCNQRVARKNCRAEEKSTLLVREGPGGEKRATTNIMEKRKKDKKRQAQTRKGGGLFAEKTTPAAEKGKEIGLQIEKGPDKEKALTI